MNRRSKLMVQVSTFVLMIFATISCGDDDELGGPPPSNMESVIRIVTVNPLTNKITLKNFGSKAQNISSYWICNLKTYAQVNGLTSDDLTLEPDETIELDRPIDNTASAVGLYNTNAFTSTDAMEDFMQYGQDLGTNGRVDIAVTKGIWSEGDFVDGGSPYQYNGSGEENGVGNWSGN